MLSILVGHSYFLRLDPKQFERAKPYPPLATLQVAASLREAGHQVALFDAMLAEGLGEYEHKLAQAAPQLVVLYEDNYNFLTKMCLAAMREACLRMIALARAAGARVVVAGSDATDAPEAYLAAGADIVLRGEGLDTLATLVRRLDTDIKAPPARLTQQLSGITYLEAGLPRQVDEPQVPSFVAQPELPAWDLVDIERYRAVWVNAHGYFSLNMAASRGCPFRCSWCAKPIWGNQYSQRSAESVAAEFTYLRHRFNPDHIWFADDIFGFRPAWVLRFAHAVREANASVPFTIQTRADLTTEPMAQALREAGCAEAWLGAESGSQRILDAMNKGTTVAEIKVARARLKAHGIRVGFFIQLGYLGEQIGDILATRDLLETARPDDVGVSVAYPLPGTKFFEQVKGQFLNGKRHWKDSGDLAMMFRGTYSSDFYRAIRDLLHEQVAMVQLDTPEHAERYEIEQQRLASRWSDLKSTESRFRATPASR
ncbi:MAG: B12-binding domain-containing radical SAM protein [Proteobacteria bacterium]|nr:B12-binding domain-containing radical SAM protein [Pseudomonadota bacterium]